MAFDVLNVGTTVNDGTGESLRSGGVKINSNFAKAVEGPASTPVTAGRVVSFSGTTGRLVQQGVGDGAVGTPSVTFASNLNTGMWRPAANTVAFSTNGAERLRIDSSGNVNVGAAGMSASNNYGVPQFGISKNSFATFHVESHNNTAIDGSFLGLMRSRGTQASPTHVNSGDLLGSISGQAYQDAVSFPYRKSAEIEFFADGNHSSTSLPGRITFSTVPSGSLTIQERMRITSAGNVGIGTSSPDVKLRVNGSTTVSSQVNVAARIGPSVDSDLLLGSVNGNAPFVASQGAYPLVFYTNAQERMQITSAGNVGIDTTAPTSLMRVGGNIGTHVYDVYLKGDSGSASYPIFKIEFGTTNTAHGVAFVEIAHAGHVSGVDTQYSLTRWKIVKAASAAAVVTNVSVDESFTNVITTSVSNNEVTFSANTVASSTNFFNQRYAVSVIGSALTTATTTNVTYTRL